jgi:hypothetical protein
MNFRDMLHIQIKIKGGVYVLEQFYLWKTSAFDVLCLFVCLFVCVILRLFPTVFQSYRRVVS